MTKQNLTKDLKNASMYSASSNLIAAGLMATVISNRLPEDLTESEQKLSLIFIMGLLTYVTNVIVVIYKKKLHPRFNAWLTKG